MMGELRTVEIRRATLTKLAGDLPEPGSAGSVLQGMEIWLALGQGDFAQGLQQTERFVRALREVNDLQGLHYVLGTNSHFLLLLGELERAADVAEEAIQISRAFEGGRISPYCWASVIASRQGDIKRASENLEKARKLVGNTQPVFMQQLEIVRAEAHLLAAQGEWEAAWAKFAENQANLAGKRWRLDVMWFGTEWAEAHLRRGEAEDLARARELLEEARRLAEDMGAFGWVELIERKLAGMASG